MCSYYEEAEGEEDDKEFKKEVELVLTPQTADATSIICDWCGHGISYKEEIEYIMRQADEAPAEAKRVRIRKIKQPR
ncbi:MAG TPA: hypothetical protein VE544_07995 [Nitrososphaeraceae archaeon]|nr:hypothetical protein [Nitrososphaeraceae archaeon]